MRAPPTLLWPHLDIIFAMTLFQIRSHDEVLGFRNSIVFFVCVCVSGGGAQFNPITNSNNHETQSYCGRICQCYIVSFVPICVVGKPENIRIVSEWKMVMGFNFIDRNYQESYYKMKVLLKLFSLLVVFKR